MTLPELIRSMIRRWPIVVAGAICTVALGYLAVSDDGVSYARTEVVFLAPTSELNPNSLKTTSEDLIITAGVVSKAISGPGKVTKFADPSVTLVGLGVRDGWAVRLPDTGGQWASNFSSQSLIVEVVARDREAALAKQHELVDRIELELASLQRDAGVDPVNDITVSVVPESGVVRDLNGSSIRALAVIGVLGVSATTACVLLVEHRARRRVGPAGANGPEPATTGVAGVGAVQ
ncbi:hypothetical protein [Agromyces cerinus]|uniref:Chain length determinant protein n=1 Tax=Agromyces cerinus subsp. cerinus TaxID=232089 RepID=A0A1N6F6A4_9MICO|nr:hypothetical protein [Agromyces cerinus]SIN90813.1 hypothetical protein SAMN05443544_1784 [Agromyces cerinus subsp. cerinus]